MHRNIARPLSARRIGESGERRVSESGKALRDKALRNNIRRLSFGQFDFHWLAIADYFATVHGNEHCQKLDGLMQAVASCSFVWLEPDRVTYCNRPEIAKFDDQGRLHCEDGPAIVYRNSWQFFYLNGIPTPKNYIETPADDLKLDEVIKEENGAIRTAVIRKFGFARLLAKESSVRVVSEADGNSLIEFKLKIGDHHNEYLRALRLKWQDKTGSKETVLLVPRLARQFGEDCPENVNDCEQVRRWTLGWPKEAMAVAET